MFRIGATMIGSLLTTSVLLAGDPYISVQPDRIEVRATTCPLADVLDSLAKQTGMKLEYQGPPPRQLISTSLTRARLTEIINSVLQGQDLSFIMRLDASGQTVERLLIMTLRSAVSSSSSSASPRPVQPESSSIELDPPPPDPIPVAEPAPEPTPEPTPPPTPQPRGPMFPPGIPITPVGSNNPVFPGPVPARAPE